MFPLSMLSLSFSSNDYLYAASNLGGLGLQLAADDAKVQSIVHCFRLFNSDCKITKHLAKEFAIAVVSKKKKTEVTLNDTLEWINGTDEVKTHMQQTMWLRAKDSIVKLNEKYGIIVTLRTTDEGIAVRVTYPPFNIKYDFDAKTKDRLANALHKIIGVVHHSKWSKSKKHQGKLAEIVAKSELSNRAILNFELQPFDWVFAVCARNNCLPVNYRPYLLRKSEVVQGCRKCGYIPECQAHIFNHCPSSLTLRNHRHNCIVDELFDYLISLELTVDKEKAQRPGEGGRPDIVVWDTKKGNIYIVDIKSPYDDIEGFKNARDENIRHYMSLAEDFRTKHVRCLVHVETIVVGAIGSWDPLNDKFFYKLGLKKGQLKHIAQKLCSTSIHMSSIMFNLHKKDKGIQNLSALSRPDKSIKEAASENAEVTQPQVIPPVENKIAKLKKGSKIPKINSEKVNLSPNPLRTFSDRSKIPQLINSLIKEPKKLIENINLTVPIASTKIYKRVNNSARDKLEKLNLINFKD